MVALQTGGWWWAQLRAGPSSGFFCRGQEGVRVVWTGRGVAMGGGDHPGGQQADGRVSAAAEAGAPSPLRT